MKALFTGRLVATQAGNLVISRDPFHPLVAGEKCPPPAVAKTRARAELARGILDHHKTPRKIPRVARSSRRQLFCLGVPDVFHENRAIGKLAVLEVSLNILALGIDRMQLL